MAGAPALAAEGEKPSVVATNSRLRLLPSGGRRVRRRGPCCCRPAPRAISYEPTPQDILKIQNADLFVYPGGEGDAWVDDILSAFDHEVPALRMIDCVDAVAEEVLEGMTATGHDHEDHEDEDHEDEDHEDEDGLHEIEYDEHVWTSPKNADLIQRAIAKRLSAVDPEDAAVYAANSETYGEALAALDRQFDEFFDGVENKTLIVGDRFPLRYFADAYGLTCYAAFPGCSNETEPSAGTIAFLIDKVRETGVSTVFYIELSNHLVADSIAEQTGAKTAMFHSGHNVSRADFDAGATYVSLMRANLETLREAMK
jgi:zinc transport system substrate-binding protein